MKYIIDTHAFIWYATGDPKLSVKARSIIDSDQDRYISVASLWEMAIKVNIGKLTFLEPFETVLAEQLKINDYKTLPISNSHLFKLSTLNLYHRDPFDRLIICQALVENFAVVSVDDQFDKYPSLIRIW